jgi:iron-sulfur cluster assembly protein
MAITLTQTAAKQIKHAVEKFGGVGLRLGVKKVGCSGFAYTFDMAKEIRVDDQTFEAFDAKVIVDTKSLSFLDGSELDYVRDGFKQLFTVKNPKVTGTCGCGESFSVAPDTAPEEASQS